MKSYWIARQTPILSLGWSEKIPPKIQELASVRGLIQWEEFQAWTQPKLAQLKDPFTLKGMSTAIERMVQAFQNQEVIALYGDFDLDGTSALALLHLGFSKLGYKNLILYQPSRLTEGYGFHPHAVESLQKSGVQLILTADVGITAVAAAQKCKELNVDLIITDHHLPSVENPDALAIINPNQGNCTSQLGHLSGVGVSFYLVWALRRSLVQMGLALETALDLKELLDCFVIGTLTDLVPLKEENRVLVKHGLKQLTKTQRPGLRYLLNELGLINKELSSQDVAIRFAPKLNALSRMEKDLRPLDLFMVQQEEEAQQLMSAVLAQNEMRVCLQSEAEQLALNLAKEWKDRPYIFIADKSFHRGVVGLVATRLSQEFQKPSFVGSIAEENIVVGSARAPQGWGGNLVEVLGWAAQYLHRFGGHALASGFEYSDEQKSAIIELLDRAFDSLSDQTNESNAIYYDIELDFEHITPVMMDWIDLLGPFGQGFEAPLFQVQSVEVKEVKELKGGHKRLSLFKEGKVREALLFSPKESQILTLKEHFVVDLLVEIQWNYFQNKKRIQLLIKEIRPTLGMDEKDLINESKSKVKKAEFEKKSTMESYI